MNKTVSKLAEQAGAILEKGYIELSDGQLMLSDNVDLDKSNLDLEKFAMLIVKECIDQFKDHPFVGVKRTQYIYGYIQGRTDAVMKIREHFGVEE